jgi:hypothetical protein
MAMTPKITPEQREALNQGPGPVPVQDDVTGRTYFLVDSSYSSDSEFAALQRGIADADAGRTSSIAEVRTRLEALLRERASK